MKSAKIFIAFTFLLAFAVYVSAQSVQFPNELKGFEFFGNGKLKDLELAVSSKNDVKKIFGDKCEKKCDYDADWSIRFEYYEDIWIKESRNGRDEKQTYLLDSQYLGKLRLIEVRPKKQVSFSGITFPNVFQKLLVTSTSFFDSDKNLLTGDEAFQDSSELRYEILNKTIRFDSKNEKARSYNKGDLVLIRYEISKKLEEKLLVEQK